MNIRKIKATVVVPVYNSEGTIRYCLESLFLQSHKNLQIIIVNDGSTDDSLRLLKNYQKQDKQRIMVFSQKNSGAPVARNLGLKKATGKYIFFLDSDDYLESDYVERFVHYLEETGADMVVGGYRRVNWEGKQLYERKARPYTWTRYMLVSTCGRGYRLSSLKRHGIKFLEMNIGEDVHMNIMANLKMDVKVLNYTGYNWVNNEKSISNTKYKGFNKSVSFLPFVEKIKRDSEKLKLSESEEEFLEYFFIKTTVYYILHSGKGVEFSTLVRESGEIFQWLNINYPRYRENIHLRNFGPEGERIFVRLVVTLYVFFQKISLEKLFLKIYSKF